MGKLFDTIRQLIVEEKYLIGSHASERLDERGIMEWQAIAAVADGELITERPKAQPNPVVEIRETLPDGTDFNAVWSYLKQSGVAKLVTVHFFDEGWSMRIPGERVKRTRLIQTDQYVVAVEVEMVIPTDDPSEPCYEPETVQLLKEVRERAERGDLTWLKKTGKVYAAVGAA
jgi:hypothetical protein